MRGGNAMTSGITQAHEDAIGREKLFSPTLWRSAEFGPSARHIDIRYPRHRTIYLPDSTVTADAFARSAHAIH
jgi:hypothetical protein